MKSRKMIALILILVLMVLITGCAKDRNLQQEREALTPTPEPVVQADVQSERAPEKALPSATSNEVELYLASENGKDYVVNAYGQRANGYSVDEEKNILDREQEIVVAAKNTEKFQYLSELNFASQRYDATLPNQGALSQTEGNPDNPTVTVLLSGTPSNATNQIVVLESSDPTIAEIKANANAKYLAEGAFNLQNGEIAVKLSEAGTARIIVTIKGQGEAVITAKSLAGKATANCVVSAKKTESNTNYLGSSQPTNNAPNPTTHIHTYTKTIVDPTPYEKGYTIYICECGHSYQDNIIPPLPSNDNGTLSHKHHYESIIVAPTSSERGYTLHLCECGDSYKDCYVSPTGR